MNGEPTNEERAEWARMALVAFSRASNPHVKEPLYDPPQDVLGDLLADLIHYCDYEDIDIMEAWKTAKMNYKAEIAEEAANDPAGW